MRIVVSGTHASGKSTLASDFAIRHPEFAVLPDPFELIDESWGIPSARMFAAQLRLSADRLHPTETAGHLIAERGPLDFLAYLLALDELGSEAVSRELIERSIEITRGALRHVDLVVVVPLAEGAEIFAPADEDLPLRQAMNDVLLDLISDDQITGAQANIVEITGDRHQRLVALEALVASSRSRA